MIKRSKTMLPYAKQKKVNLANKASIGIRAISDEFLHSGERIQFGIEPHIPKGKYLVTVYYIKQGKKTIAHELKDETGHMMWFDNFYQCIAHILEEYNVSLEYDDDKWKKNINYTQRQLDKLPQFVDYASLLIHIADTLKEVDGIHVNWRVLKAYSEAWMEEHGVELNIERQRN